MISLFLLFSLFFGCIAGENMVSSPSTVPAGVERHQASKFATKDLIDNCWKFVDGLYFDDGSKFDQLLNISSCHLTPMRDQQMLAIEVAKCFMREIGQDLFECNQSLCSKPISHETISVCRNCMTIYGDQVYLSNLLHFKQTCIGRFYQDSLAEMKKERREVNLLLENATKTISIHQDQLNDLSSLSVTITLAFKDISTRMENWTFFEDRLVQKFEDFLERDIRRSLHEMLEKHEVAFMESVQNFRDSLSTQLNEVTQEVKEFREQTMKTLNATLSMFSMPSDFLDVFSFSSESYVTNVTCYVLFRTSFHQFLKQMPYGSDVGVYLNYLLVFQIVSEMSGRGLIMMLGLEEKDWFNQQMFRSYSYYVDAIAAVCGSILFGILDVVKLFQVKKRKNKTKGRVPALVVAAKSPIPRIESEDSEDATIISNISKLTYLGSTANREAGKRVKVTKTS